MFIAALHATTDGYEANSLIVNVAGRILMLQKDRPAAERRGRKVIIYVLIKSRKACCMIIIKKLLQYSGH